MSPHARVFGEVRTALAASTFDADTSALLAGSDDARLARLLFSNARGSGAQMRGHRLTRLGVEILRQLFRSYEIARQVTGPVSVREILYVERRSTLPYYIDERRIVVFDDELAITLAMLDGDLAQLVRNET